MVAGGNGDDDVTVDLVTAAARAGLTIEDLETLVASGAIRSVDGGVATDAIAQWIDEDRAARRLGLAALAAGVGAEVYY